MTKFKNVLEDSYNLESQVTKYLNDVNSTTEKKSMR